MFAMVAQVVVVIVAIYFVIAHASGVAIDHVVASEL